MKSFLFYTNNKPENDLIKKRFLDGIIMRYFVEDPSNMKERSKKKYWEQEDLIVEELDKIISKYKGVKEIRVVGDGDLWIKNISSLIGGKYIADKFHLRKYVRDLLGKRYHIGLNLINEKMPGTELRKKLYNLVANSKTGEISSKALKQVRYIVKNQPHYLFGVQNDCISAIEGIQSHYIGRFFKKQRKGWSLKTLESLIPVLSNFFNQEYSNNHNF